MVASDTSSLGHNLFEFKPVLLFLFHLFHLKTFGTYKLKLGVDRRAIAFTFFIVIEVQIDRKVLWEGLKVLLNFLRADHIAIAPQMVGRADECGMELDFEQLGIPGFAFVLKLDHDASTKRRHSVFIHIDFNTFSSTAEERQFVLLVREYLLVVFLQSLDLRDREERSASCERFTQKFVLGVRNPPHLDFSESLYLGRFYNTFQHGLEVVDEFDLARLSHSSFVVCESPGTMESCTAVQVIIEVDVAE